MKPLLSIIIPTYDNYEQLTSCIRSIFNSNDPKPGMLDIWVINNGSPSMYVNTFKNYPLVHVINAGKNLGWEGGLKEGLKNTEAPFVMFLNDDTYFPVSSRLWYQRLLGLFKDERVGAVGPSSNCVTGTQNIFLQVPSYWLDTKFLIGYCMIVRRKALDEAGGIDSTMPGGDDFDLSIRIRDKGYKLICSREVFVYHHGFQTGQRLHGSDWNSDAMKEATHLALIKKHGMLKFHETISPFAQHTCYGMPKWNEEDSEGIEIRKVVNEGDKILEIGCGAKKTIPNSVGLDIIPSKEQIPNLDPGMNSVADIVADATEPLPIKDKYDCIIARHVFEHCIDPVKIIKQWGEVLIDGGKMIIAVPTEGLIKSIPMNPDHFHAYTQDSLKNFMEAMGYKTLEIIDPKNFVSIIGVFQK